MEGDPVWTPNWLVENYMHSMRPVLTRIKSDFQKSNILKAAYRPNTAATERRL
jgi:hypothetical protein